MDWLLHNLHSSELVFLRVFLNEILLVCCLTIHLVTVCSVIELTWHFSCCSFTIVLKEESNNHSFFIVPFAIVFPLCALIMCLFFVSESTL